MHATEETRSPLASNQIESVTELERIKLIRKCRRWNTENIGNLKMLVPVYRLANKTRKSQLFLAHVAKRMEKVW